jgi:hypothetical protein
VHSMIAAWSEQACGVDRLIAIRHLLGQVVSVNCTVIRICCRNSMVAHHTLMPMFMVMDVWVYGAM